MNALSSVTCRILFIGAFVLAGLAVWEKLANILGYTLLRDYAAGRFLEFSIVALVFVIALQLRELKVLLGTKDPG